MNISLLRVLTGLLGVLLVPSLSFAGTGPNDLWLSIDPASSSPVVGETFTADIVLNNPRHQMLDGVELTLRFNPALLEVQDSDTVRSGTQVRANTSFLSDSPVNRVTNTDATHGSINFARVGFENVFFSGDSAVVATITFRALLAGSASLTYDFTLGSTSDSNVIYSLGDPVDLLTDATGAAFTLRAPPPTVARWVSASFTPAEVAAADPAVIGITADPDGDGLQNLVEYALNTDPKSSNRPQGFPKPELSNLGVLTLVYTRIKGATDLRFSVEVASELLGPWTALPAGSAEVSVVDNGDTETVTARDTVANATRFMRLQIQYLPGNR